MSGIRGVGGGVSPMMFDDPMMAAEAISIDAAREERNAARNDRHAAQAERDSLFDQSIQEERAAADLRLASGIVSGAVKIAQGGLTIGATVAEHAGSRDKIDATSLREKARAQQNRDQPILSPELQGQLRSLDRSSNDASQLAGNIRASSDLAQGAGSIATAGLDFAADGHRIHGKELEKASDRAREAADDARERGQNAGETAGRLMNRMEDIARAQRQAEDQRIANIRG